MEESIYDFDELKMYFGEDYWVTNKICIKQPKLGDILEFGDSKFYSVVNTLCGNPTTFRLKLWKMGIDWNTISDFTMFCMIVKMFTPKDTYLIFGDLNLSWFDLKFDEVSGYSRLIYHPRDEENNILSPNQDDEIVIDELVYTRLIKYLRLMFNINPKVEKAKNKATKIAMIEEEEMNLAIEKQKSQKRDYSKSFLLPLVSSLVNHPGFKYKTNELKEIGIVQFMDSVKRLQVYENSTALLKGMYSGFIDISKDKKLQKELNWLKDLTE